jgi:hypothetical protein
MNAWNAVGFLAAGLVITAFCMKDIWHSLRTASPLG